ncbi:DsbA family protein, partial [Pseudomonas aeruginosa]|uniref:DsbA family protein n=1 Tax=Pseudomonas aeruginosa TaxID=287 RepID=UPI001F281AA5
PFTARLAPPAPRRRARRLPARRPAACRRDCRHAFASLGASVRRGVFGAPSFFVGDQLFFGQDRLDFVAEALAG